MVVTVHVHKPTLTVILMFDFIPRSSCRSPSVKAVTACLVAV